MSIIQVNGHTVFANRLNRESRVLDIGANRGAFALGMRERFACDCVCVEPNPALRPFLTSQPGLKVLSVALAAQPGSIPFHVSVNSEASSLLGGSLGGWAKLDEIDVEAMTLPQSLERADWTACDLIKMDIEGSEIEVLESCSDTFLRSVPQFTIEFHDFCGITPGADIERVAQRFERLGFSMLSTWRSFHGDVVFVQRRRVGLGLAEFLFAKYWLKNWWGLRRILARTFRGQGA